MNAESLQRAGPNVEKPSFFSIPGDPNIPSLVRAYGTIIRVANGIGLIVASLAFFTIVPQAPQFGIFCFLQVAVSAALFTVGKFIRDGEKFGINALSVLALLQILVGLALSLLSPAGLIIGLTTMVSVSIFLLPPIIVARTNWKKFH